MRRLLSKHEKTGSIGTNFNESVIGELDESYGYKLGIDDPFWPCYLEEAEKYDDLMIKKWDKKMETLLLFATLFSAIVTAFVIQSSPDLQPDSAAITAAAVVEMVEILRNRTANSQPEFPIPNSPDNFQPSASAFIVNFTWFISLFLSITVALLAGLVKQWCSTLLWDRTAPPCSQARIRQARLNRLIGLRTDLVISALPVIMDAALGLFLLGLLVFLHDLSNIIFLAALGLTLLTTTFYFGTTFAPFFVSFCPYETALSSRRTWGFFYRVCRTTGIWIAKHFRDFDDEAEVDLSNHMFPCQKEETSVASNTIPDQLTGDALKWIILHSQKPEPREMAIRAIATLDSTDVLKRLVSDPPGILPQVIQSFTSCFIVNGVEKGVVTFGFKESITANMATLHGRALTALVAQVLLEGDINEYQVQGPYLHNDIEATYTHSKWVIDSATKEAVKARFEHLVKMNSTEASLKAWALVGSSVWCDFIGIDGGPRFNQGKVVCEMASSLDTSLPLALRQEVLHTLTKELSYWAPNASSKHQKDILRHLINLIHTAPPPEYPQLACALVVLTLNLNHGTSYPLLPNDLDSRVGGYPEGKVGDGFADKFTDHYATHPGDLAKDGQALMLFALTGLMEYYEHCDFDDEAHQNMRKIAARFQTFDSLGQLQSIRLLIGNSPGLKMKDVDIRAYFIRTVLTYLGLPRTAQHDQSLDDILMHLLKAINPKRQSCELEEYGPQIIPLVTQILVQTTDVELQTQCLSTIVTYWDSGPSILYSRMQLLYETPLKLLETIKNKAQQLPSNSTLKPNTSLLFENMGKRSNNFSLGDDRKLVSCMENVVHKDLLEILIDVVHIRGKIVPPRPHDHSPEAELGLFVESPLLQRVRSYLKDDGPALVRGSGELLLKKMVETYRENQVEIAVVRRWRSYKKPKDDTPRALGSGNS